jgi:hypothetical protein
MSKLTNLQRLIVLERSHGVHRADITAEHANLRAWSHGLGQAKKDKLFNLLNTAERQQRRRVS